jgi:hypothetical protein
VIGLAGKAGVVAALVGLLAGLPASAQVLKTHNHTEFGVSLDLPAEWTSLQHPAGVMSSSNVRNQVGQPIGMVTLSTQDLEGKSFNELTADSKAGAERRNSEGDVHLFEPLEHSAGPAFFTTRRTTKGDKTQVVQAYYIEAAGKVFRINCASPLSTEPDQLLELYRAIVDSFSVG